MLKLILTILLSSHYSLLASAAPKKTEPLNRQQIEKLTGLKGQWSEEEKVFKVTYPRDDLKVRVGEVKLTPHLGLTAWSAFTQTGNQVMVMGDLVLTEEQVNAVMDAALENGLEVTALHNHFLMENPKVMFMHIGGMGKEEDLARAVGKVFNTLKETIKKAPVYPSARIDPAQTKLSEKVLEKTIRHQGKMNKGVYKITIPRPTHMHGHKIGNAMGANTWAAFSGTDQQAVVIGDFAMYEDELQGVLKALRKNKIQVVAIHNHMTHEKPRLMFLHYWGIGPAGALAAGIRAALDTQKEK